MTHYIEAGILVTGTSCQVRINVSLVTYTGLHTKDIAIACVYGTVTNLDIKSDLSSLYEYGWLFKVETGFYYFGPV